METALDIASSLLILAGLAWITGRTTSTGHIAVVALAVATVVGLTGVVSSVVMVLLAMVGVALGLPAAPGAPGLGGGRFHRWARVLTGVVVGTALCGALAWRVDPLGNIRVHEPVTPGPAVEKLVAEYLPDLGLILLTSLSLWVFRRQTVTGVHP